MIDVKNLSKSYGTVEALKNISFSIEKGEVIGFLGPNGAGKTTCMKILTCFMPPSAGEVKIKGLNIETDAFEIQKMIGYLPEDTPLYSDLSPAEYLNFIAKIRKIPKSQIKEKIDRVVSLCQIAKVMNKPIDELSKGFKQRVGLAQALIHEPELLILDEPTNGLDPNQIIEIRNLIKDLGKEATIIICSHILSEVSATCSRVFILKEGEIVADGEPKALTEAQDSEKIIFIDSNQSLEEFKNAIPKLITDISDIKSLSQDKPFYKLQLRSPKDIREKIFEVASKNKWRLRELSMQERNLEDLFIKLTKEN